MIYNDKVISIFKNPMNVGEIENPDGESVVSSACGDSMKITLKINNGIIQDAKFKTFGCAAAIATSSVATEMIKGLTIQEGLKFTNQKVVEYLGGLPEKKIHCSMLAETGIKKAIENYLNKQK